MKTSRRFLVIILISVIGLLVLGGATYLYKNNVNDSNDVIDILPLETRQEIEEGADIKEETELIINKDINDTKEKDLIKIASIYATDGDDIYCNNCGSGNKKMSVDINTFQLYYVEIDINQHIKSYEKCNIGQNNGCLSAYGRRGKLVAFDKNYIYRYGNSIENSDPESLSIEDSLNGYIFDNNNVYYFNYIVQDWEPVINVLDGFNPDKFQILSFENEDTEYVTDGVNVAYRVRGGVGILKDIKADSISLLGKEVITDGEKVFYHSSVLSEIEPESVKLHYKDNQLLYIQDKDSIYKVIAEFENVESAILVPNVDVNTFDFLE